MGVEVKTTGWTVAAKTTFKWYRGFHEAAELIMVRWPKYKADASRKHHVSAVGSANGKGKRGGNGRKETAGRVERYHAHQ